MRGGPPDLDRVLGHHREFHDLLLSGSQSLRAVVGGLVHSTILVRTYQAFDADAMHRSVEHHLELVAAVRARDADWAESRMRSHLYSAVAALLGPRSSPGATMASTTPLPAQVPTRALHHEESE